MWNKIQEFILPTGVVNTPHEMYYRNHGTNVHYSNQNHRLEFQADSIASLDTYFNGFSTNIWKNYTNVKRLRFKVQGEGKFIVRIGVHAQERPLNFIKYESAQLKPGEPIEISIDDLTTYNNAMLYLDLRALSKGFISGCSIWTDAEPRRDVKLGIVITHFDRKNYVLPAIERLSQELLSDPNYKDRVELFVIDNSQNIEEKEAGLAHVIPNENLGGSGGFMRGLLELKSRADFTHCLFMDDDASCETESIKRSYQLLTYANDESMAVAGSLLRELEPNRLFEKGAYFDGRCKPIKSGLDMNIVPDLLYADQDDCKPDYGGWWFFAFSIDYVKTLAFPFFVRGDDVNFSLDNKFDIITMNGIGVWGEDFGTKSAPMQTYLDMRYHLLHAIKSNRKSARKNMFRTLNVYVIGQMMCYNYASAEATLMAIDDVLQGPEFFTKNLDTKEIRAQIATLEPNEKMLPISRRDYNVEYRHGLEEARLRRMFRWASFNGYLIPSFLLKDAYVHQSKSFHGALRQIFPYRHVYYEHEASGTGYVVSQDKKRAIKNLMRYSQLRLKLRKNWKSLHERYQEAWPEMTSNAAWAERLNMEADQTSSKKLHSKKLVKRVA